MLGFNSSSAKEPLVYRDGQPAINMTDLIRVDPDLAQKVFPFTVSTSGRPQGQPSTDSNPPMVLPGPATNVSMQGNATYLGDNYADYVEVAAAAAATESPEIMVKFGQAVDALQSERAAQRASSFAKVKLTVAEVGTQVAAVLGVSTILGGIVAGAGFVSFAAAFPWIAGVGAAFTIVGNGIFYLENH